TLRPLLAGTLSLLRLAFDLLSLELRFCLPVVAHEFGFTLNGCQWLLRHHCSSIPSLWKFVIWRAIHGPPFRSELDQRIPATQPQPRRYDPWLILTRGLERTTLNSDIDGIRINRLTQRIQGSSLCLRGHQLSLPFHISSSSLMVSSSRAG